MRQKKMREFGFEKTRVRITIFLTWEENEMWIKRDTKLLTKSRMRLRRKLYQRLHVFNLVNVCQRSGAVGVFHTMTRVCPGFKKISGKNEREMNMMGAQHQRGGKRLTKPHSRFHNVTQSSHFVAQIR